MAATDPVLFRSMHLGASVRLAMKVLFAINAMNLRFLWSRGFATKIIAHRMTLPLRTVMVMVNVSQIVT